MDIKILRRLLKVTIFFIFSINFLLTNLSYAKASIYDPIDLGTSLKKKFSGKYITADQFYLLGWSSNGKRVAYAVEEETDAKGTFSIKIYIQNLVSDEILWQVHQEAEWTEYANFKKYWKVNYPYLKFVLKHNKIQLSKDFKIRSFPLTYKGDSLDCKVETKLHKKTSTNEDYNAGLEGYKLLLSSKKRGEKRLVDRTFGVKESVFGWGTYSKVKAMGYFQSPDKSRLAILVGRLGHGFEGSKIIRFDIVGASLQSKTWD